MAAKKKAAGSIGKKMTATGKAGVRRREKAIKASGVNKARGERAVGKQSNTKIARREQGERGAKRRVGAVAKKIEKLNAKAKAGKVSRKQFASQTRVLRKSMAKAARLSKSAAGGAG